MAQRVLIDEATLSELLAALKEANAWNNSDIRGFEDISPDMNMLKARRRVLRTALRLARNA